MTIKAFNADGNDFDFLIGKRIKEVVNKNDSYQLTTTDGEKITITVNEGCGGCANGWSDIDDLKVLEDSDNAIMNVVCSQKDYEDQFKLFIYYHDKTLEIEGDDGYGNGYYGGGFWVTIEKEGSE